MLTKQHKAIAEEDVNRRITADRVVCTKPAAQTYSYKAEAV